MGRIASLACAAAVLVVGAGAARAVPAAGQGRSWAYPQIRTVVAAGLMAPSVEAFRPQDPLTRGELADALEALGAPRPEFSDPDQVVTMRELDARLVAFAGLREEARHVRTAALEAGLSPKSSLGAETVARLLGLRVNHPKAQEQLELELSQAATRAEAAYSIARLLTIQDTEIETLREAADAFSLPSLTYWQRLVLDRALRFVGFPYVWAGTSEKPQLIDGTLMPGGFDCSGFVWRVYKLQAFAGAPSLAGIVRGRTTYAMSGEIPRSARIPRDRLAPGDLVFFGPRGPKSRPSEIGHVGIYLGNGWLVHAYRNGVAMEPMVGWLETTFAWGRSPLTEAGLS
jgi:cell wall-associated NlpC family hydrolase